MAAVGAPSPGPLTVATAKDVNKRYRYRPTQPAYVASHECVRARVEQLGLALIDLVPPCRERDLAFDALDQVLFNCNAAINRHGR